MQVTADVLSFNDIDGLLILTYRADEALLLNQGSVLKINQKVLRLRDADASVFC